MTEEMTRPGDGVLMVEFAWATPAATSTTHTSHARMSHLPGQPTPPRGPGKPPRQRQITRRRSPPDQCDARNPAFPLLIYAAQNQARPHC